MPEYLAPGVFVEEVSFRSKSIEGVATSTTGFTGMTRWGPVWYAGGPALCEPRLITSFTEFERVYGGLAPLHLNPDDPTADRLSYTAHGARAFFDNGGKRLYISRVFTPRSNGDTGRASVDVNVGDDVATWRARWPGADGNVHVRIDPVRSKNVAVTPPGGGSLQASSARDGSVVEIFAAGDTLPGDDTPLELSRLRVVAVDDDGTQTFVQQDGSAPALNAGDRILLVKMRATVTFSPERSDVYDDLEGAANLRRYIGRILQRDDPEDPDAMIWLDWESSGDPFEAAQLTLALTTNPTPRLTGGNDGLLATPDDLAGEAADPDDASKKATGLEALAEIDDIAIVALPDGGAYDDELSARQAADRLITHASARRAYRIAIVDGPRASSLNEIRNFRGKFDSSYAALYHPWIEILDPTERAAQGARPKTLTLPPSAFMAGIYARTDISRGVHKAPANEVVRGLTRFEANINTPRQEVLNPEGINALRFFEGRGYRVWGARTMSSDPEWKYVNVRRLFLFIEHSIDVGTQFAVFEPNGPRLWANIRRAVEDFLLVLWRDGALLGDKPEQAYFVRCDRTTMTQNDLDNGRMICLIGIAPVKPAEFVIFRIGQWTADAAG